MSAPFTEKRGNAAWVQCRQCSDWLPVGAALLASSVKLHCPHCHHEFAAGDARKIIRPE